MIVNRIFQEKFDTFYRLHRLFLMGHKSGMKLKFRHFDLSKTNLGKSKILNNQTFKGVTWLGDSND